MRSHLMRLETKSQLLKISNKLPEQTILCDSHKNRFMSIDFHAPGNFTTDNLNVTMNQM